jgi:hypothetical protein
METAQSQDIFAFFAVSAANPVWKKKAGISESWPRQHGKISKTSHNFFSGISDIQSRLESRSCGSLPYLLSRCGSGFPAAIFLYCINN